jgi:2-polyprenyl-3-methyl-5-hydroxy-6-metoxy-1,4-benzoquinol methylase
LCPLRGNKSNSQTLHAILELRLSHVRELFAYHLAGAEDTETLDIGGMLPWSRAEAAHLAQSSQRSPSNN